MSVGKYYRQNVSVGNSVGFIRFSGSVMMAEPKKGSIVGNWKLIRHEQKCLHCS
jgi:hypothetical protein